MQTSSINLGLESVNLAVRVVEICCPGQSSVHATGSIWNFNDDLYLITNWHVFSGQHAFSGEYLNKGGARPEKVSLSVSYYGPREPPWTTLLGRNNYALRLIDDEGRPLWLQHRDFIKHRIDIAALKVGPTHPTDGVLNRIEFSKLYCEVGSQAFVVGCPLFGEKFFPDDKNDLNKGGFTSVILKSAVIATQPRFPWDGRPAFLIDATTFGGMSGSPVLIRSYGPALIDNGTFTNGTPIISLFPDGPAIRTRLLGIYSSHLTNKNQENVHLGVVWREDLVGQIINDNIQGTYFNGTPDC